MLTITILSSFLFFILGFGLLYGSVSNIFASHFFGILLEEDFENRFQGTST
jgi:uncharacterized protein involved in cysteine biosynthesis